MLKVEGLNPGAAVSFAGERIGSGWKLKTLKQKDGTLSRGGSSRTLEEAFHGSLPVEDCSTLERTDGIPYTGSLPILQRWSLPCLSCGTGKIHVLVLQSIAVKKITLLSKNTCNWMYHLIIYNLCIIRLRDRSGMIH